MFPLSKNIFKESNYCDCAWEWLVISAKTFSFLYKTHHKQLYAQFHVQYVLITMYFSNPEGFFDTSKCTLIHKFFMILWSTHLVYNKLTIIGAPRSLNHRLIIGRNIWENSLVRIFWTLIQTKHHHFTHQPFTSNYCLATHPRPIILFLFPLSKDDHWLGLSRISGFWLAEYLQWRGKFLCKANKATWDEGRVRNIEKKLGRGENSEFLIIVLKGDDILYIDHGWSIHNIEIFFQDNRCKPSPGAIWLVFGVLGVLKDMSNQVKKNLLW